MPLTLQMRSAWEDSAPALSPNEQNLLYICWFLTGLAVVIGSLSPGNSYLMTHFDKLMSHFHIGDKVEHFGAYLLLAFPAAWSFRRIPQVAAVAGGLLLMGGSIEFLQALVPGRTPDIMDFLANTAGIGIGVAFGTALRFVWRKTSPVF